MDIFVLDRNLEPIEMVDDYTSVIWAKRYFEFGDFEIYVAASDNHVASMVPGNYIARSDDDMVGVIRKVELKTSAEDGDYLVVTGVDARGLLDQRVVWTTTTAQGNAETFVRKLISDACMVQYSSRQFRKANGNALMVLDAAVGFTDEDTEQVSYKNLGAKLREICRRYGWGSKIYLSGGQLHYTLYAGDDLSVNVVFSEDYGNLLSSDYTDDYTNVANVALVGGQGEGSDRAVDSAGTAEGVDRFEVFIDARQESKDITWADLIELYPNGTIYSNGNAFIYQVPVLDLQVYDSNQLLRLQTDYPGGIVVYSTSGQRYYRLTNQVVADLSTDDPDSDTTVTLRNIVYKVYLVARGYDEIAESGAKTEFAAEVDIGGVVKYKTDYDLGDIVGIRNAYGISVTARITEVIEYDDETGYHVEPTFEYIDE